ncbi:DUF4333 domain-containing protein [Streptomyces sp. NPDC058221]|uniref:DUF4333 domain-containing protein n=1 Tax=Streptomyces sp. NPDC058221 TaxID=3346388 RepID=UPI0036E7E275
MTVLFAVGCSASVGSKVVKKDEVEKQASAALSKKVGRDPDSVSCKDDLKAEVGETVRCTLTAGGTKLGMTATAKSVDGDNVKMDFKVDDAPAAGGSADPSPGNSVDPAPSDSAQPTDAASPGVGGGEPSVEKAEVARQGKAALTAQAGKAPDAFSCKENLPARVNATVRCQLASDGKLYGVTVTATSVIGGKVKMNFKVDSTPNG